MLFAAAAGVRRRGQARARLAALLLWAPLLWAPLIWAPLASAPAVADEATLICGGTAPLWALELRSGAVMVASEAFSPALSEMLPPLPVIDRSDTHLAAEFEGFTLVIALAAGAGPVRAADLAIRAGGEEVLLSGSCAPLD